MRYTGMSESRCFRRCHNNNSSRYLHILITSPCAQLTTSPPVVVYYTHIPAPRSQQLTYISCQYGRLSRAIWCQQTIRRLIRWGRQLCTCAQGRNCPHKPISRRPSFAYVFRNFTRTPNFLRAYGNAIETVMLCMMQHAYSKMNNDTCTPGHVVYPLE